MGWILNGERERGYQSLRHRDFRLLWSANLVSGAGTQMQRIAIAWQLFELTGDPFQLGLLGLCRFVPLLLFGLAGGVIADRGDRRRTLMLSETALLVVSVVLALFAFAGTTSPLVIYAATALAAIFSAVSNPVRQALIPALAPGPALPGAMAMNGLAMQIGAMLGPAIGGVLLAQWGSGLLYVCDAASFGVVLLALLFMRARPVVASGASRGLAAAREGLHFLREQPVLLGLMSLDFLATFFGGSTVLMPIFAENVLGGGASTLGLLLAAPAAGALLGGVVMATIRLPRRTGLGVLIAVTAYGGCVLGFGLSTQLWLSLALLAGSGAADAVSMALRQTLRNLVTPDALRGRIAAAHSTFAMGGPQLGEFEAGVVASAASAPVAVVIGGVGVLVSTALVAWRAPGLARHRIGDPDAQEPVSQVAPG